MGVTGLWTVVQPVARPVKLETLNRKRLAVDASIWIYQFLKAVRDKEGNALRNSHVVGFFRRICKLLFFGIKPVFVFDGGAPILKRQTISARKARREGRREDAVRTAGKLLAVQMHRRAEEEDRKRKRERAGGTATAQDIRPDDEEPLPENFTYVDEQLMTPAEKAKNRKFRKKDAYHLPDLDVSLSEMGAPNDPRIMSQEELEEYARQFNDGEDISLYDFSKIDFDSTFFQSLPPADQYNILNAARLRSRLRMGYSKEQLDKMFPDRMAFSRFQIERVQERNDLTQRLMNINGMNPNEFGTGRIAGEKGKEYMLVKNDGVEGGWVLGVVSNKDEGKEEQPIDLDKPLPPPPVIDESDDSFEDVPVEGLNRLPKHMKRTQLNDEEDAAVQMSIYNDIQSAADREQTYSAREQRAAEEQDDGLFVPMDKDSEDDELFEDVPAPVGDASEDEELQRAIQMSLQQDSGDEDITASQAAASKARAERVRREKASEFSKRNAISGKNFAQYANARAARIAPRPRGADETVNPELRAAFEAGRKMGNKKKAEDEAPPAQPPKAVTQAHENKNVLSDPDKFKGPLPFESLNMGKSLFSKKRKEPAREPEKKPEEEEGGFQKDDDKEKPKPLPPWFAGDMDKKEYQHSQIQKPEDSLDKTDQPQRRDATLKRSQTGEVIDLDAEDDDSKEPIEIVDSDEEASATEDPDLKMDDVAEKVRAEPPKSTIPDAIPAAKDGAKKLPATEVSDTKADDVAGKPSTERIESKSADGVPTDHSSFKKTEDATAAQIDADVARSPQPQSITADDAVHSPGEDSFAWEESDYEDREARVLANPPEKEESSPEPEFEDVAVPDKPKSPSPEPEFEDVQMAQDEPVAASPMQDIEAASLPAPLPEDDSFVQIPPDDMQFEDEFSDPEDDELLRQLAVEAEEHARFAAQLNVAASLQTVRDYEQELKQLRNQQRADRRDADEVTTIMIQECQQLLRLFGLPYITAPMEAEAQCAELLNLGLVDGIVTDDSDIFLFGGTRVYKNMFSQAKFVEHYLFNDMSREYGLTREKIIQIAHLLGSDYTDGVPGVGPVTALEIISEFGSVKAFSEWWADVQTGVAPTDAKGFRKRFRKNAAKIFLPPGFPDPRVDEAYLKPEVDADPSPFQWGVPDLEALRQFLMSTIGWSPERTDEILVPVIRDMNQRDAEGTQANLTHFFSNSTGGRNGGASAVVVGAGDGSREAYAPRRRQEGKSSRMEHALERLHQRTRRRAMGEDESEEDNAAAQETAPPKEKSTPAKAAPKKRKAAKSKKAQPDEATADDEHNDEDDDAENTDEEAYQPPKKAPRKGTRGGRQAKKKT